MSRQQLLEAIARRRALGLPSAETQAFRLIHGAGDGIDGLTVDVYDRHLVASSYIEPSDPRERAWVAALGELDYDGVYLKRRPRQANVLSEGERQQRAPEHAVVGADAAPEIVVQESGIPFAVRLGDGLSTGLFLDQRDNRARLGREARDRSVLNLFAYTCAFGVAAALGGASHTVNIDVAKNVLARGQRNYALSGVLSERHLFLARDVLDALPKIARKGERFDIVVLDPPSYASTRTGRFSVARDYPELVTSALQLVAEGGTLLACSNHHKLTERELARVVETSVKRSGRHLQSLELVPPPADHPAAPGRTPHLKSAWIRLK